MKTRSSGKSGKRVTGLLFSALLIANAALPAYAGESHDFRVASLDSATAIQEFATQSGVQILAAADTVKGRRFNPVMGEHTTEEGLALMLKGTGLTHRYMGGRAVALVDEAAPAKDAAPSLAGKSAKETQKRSFWDNFRLAQADSGSTEPPVAGGNEARVEEVVVTAQKRSENIMTVPISISALTSSSIASRGLVNAEDYLRTVPSVAYINQGPGQDVVVIRGSYGDAFATAPTVGRYLGDMPLTGLALGATVDVKLVDMERVEVLRGPQGTLYGSNSLSGTIRNIPASPRLDEFDSHVAIGYSNTSRYGGDNGEVQGMVNIPLAQSKVALRAVAYRFENTGFIRNIAGDSAAVQTAAAFFGQQEVAGNRNHLGDTTTTGGRIALLWSPIENLNFTLNYLRQDDSADDRPYAQRGLGRYERATYNFGDGNVGSGDALKIKLDIANLTVDYELPWGSFVSSTSLIHQDYRRLWQIGSFFPVNGLAASIPQNSITHARNMTEEARFTSSFAGPVQVIAGVFYEDSRQPTSQIAYYSGIEANNPLTSRPGTSIGTPRGAGSLYGGDIERATKQLAGFGEVSYAITDRLKLTGGVRQFHYNYEFGSAIDAFTLNSSVVTLGNQFVDKQGESGHTFKGAVEFKPTESSLVYGKFSQGFRLGRPKNISQVQTLCDTNGDGLIDGTGLSATDPLIHSDNLDSYEIGAKATALDGRLSVSVAGYHNDWNDIPVTIRPQACPGVAAVFNVGKVEVDGFELEGALRLATAFTVDFGLGYVDSKLAETNPLGAKGAQMNYTPKWNGHLGTEYSLNVNGRRTYLRADYSYYGEYWNGLGQTGSKFDSYGLIGLSLGANIGKFDLRVFADNVTNKYAITSDITFPSNGVFPVRPRTIGFSAGYTF